MINERIAVPYNHNLKRLERLLAGVKRAGDFFVRGSLDAPIRRVEIDGVGVLSFPVPASQLEAVIERAHRAPYGRGKRTLIDTSVRNAWRLDAADVRIGGKTWKMTFDQIMSTVVAGLGCPGMNVSATLYKLLVYETGGLFRPHRDTEKSDGMFGTLVLVLPSVHVGGELIVRHGTRDVSVNLSGAEVSELTFAVFYADCEHEVRPITHGGRVCLTYNLSLADKGKPKQHAALTPPLQTVGELFADVARAHVPTRGRECMDLLSRLVREHDHARDSAWPSGLRKIAAPIIEALPKRQKRSATSDLDDRLARPHDIGEPQSRMRRWCACSSTALRPSMHRTCAAPRATPLPPPTRSTPPE
jgi:hypothetical protein